jgi:predicted nicotinamide N-methyase
MSSGRLDPDDYESVARFITENTELISPPLVPEVRLHLAAESLPLWQKTEDELGEMNVPPPFWAFAWAGGQAVARYLIDHPEICAGRTVLDLGCGGGIAAIAAGKAGARRLLAADIDKLALVACSLNARANDIDLETSNQDLLAEPPRSDDVIIIGDLFYERELAERVVAYIVEAKARGSAVYVGDPQRSYFPESRFTQLADYQVAVTRELEDAEIKRTAVWRA